ncbi:MAG: DUF2147 domain-containing protein, partial [Pseudomonadota bacterium]
LRTQHVEPRHRGHPARWGKRHDGGPDRRDRLVLKRQAQTRPAIGDGTPCGTLVWFDETNAVSDRDINNPDPELRDRPVKGMVMLSGFERSGDRWRRGRIYNAENGRTYRSAVSVRDDGNLKLQGCVGPICQTQTWTPLPEDDPRVTGD